MNTLNLAEDTSSEENQAQADLTPSIVKLDAHRKESTPTQHSQSSNSGGWVDLAYASVAFTKEVAKGFFIILCWLIPLAVLTMSVGKGSIENATGQSFSTVVSQLNRLNAADGRSTNASPLKNVEAK